MRTIDNNQTAKKISHKKAVKWARKIAYRIDRDHGICGTVYIYPVPRGGVPAAYLVMSQLFLVAPWLTVYITNNINNADVIIDDLVDTGHTSKWYKAQYPNIRFMALTKKRNPNDWLVFPWEDQDYHHPVMEQEPLVTGLADIAINFNHE